MSIDSVVKEVIDAIKSAVTDLDYDRKDGYIGGAGRLRALCDLLDDAYARQRQMDDELHNKIKEILPGWSDKSHLDSR